MLVECARMCEMSAALMSMNEQFAKEHCNMKEIKRHREINQKIMKY